MHYDVFNGDADGICALHQLRLAYPRDSELVTGVKRDIGLLENLDCEAGDSVTVLDISLDKNRTKLIELLNDKVSVDYFDHHYSGEIPSHPSLMSQINTASDVCTSLLVNTHLEGKFCPWAVVGTFGDNLFNSAIKIARDLNYSESQLQQLEALGTLINYNGYGSKLEDLYFHPKTLYEKIRPYHSPFDFINHEAAFNTLNDGYLHDMQQADAVNSQTKTASTALYILPDAPWARRVSGVYSNKLARNNPDRAHAIVTAVANQCYQISVRAPLNNKQGADELCRQFPSGGGRKAAAGINNLPQQELDTFSKAFVEQFK